MRKTLAALLLTTALPVQADTITLDPVVSAALITGSGGIVTYTAPAQLPAGQHTLVVHLPESGHLNGPRNLSFGDATGIRLLSLSAATDYARPIPRDPSPELQAARDALQEATLALRTHTQTVEAKQAEQSAAELQLQLMQVTASNGLGPADTGIQAEQLAAVAATLAKTVQDARQTISRITTELAALTPRTTELTESLARAQALVDSLQPDRHDQLVQMSYDIQVDTPQQVSVVIERVEDMFWRPIYAADLVQSQTTGQLNLHRFAEVGIGRAGMKPLTPWTDVQITLSTANLRDATATRFPTPRIKHLIDADKLRRARKVDSLSSERYAADAEPVVEPVIIVEESTGVAFSGQTVLFNLGGGHGADWRTDESLFAIDTLAFDLDLYALANAARDANPFLYADLTNDTGGVLLPGSIALNRDGTPVGTAHLPLLSPGQTEPIGFGPIYGIQLHRDTLSVEEGDSGFITSSSEINRSYRTTITSALPHSMPFQLLDVIPTSEDEDLEIRLNARPRPTEENRDGQRGVLVWSFDLDAGSTEQVDFAYTMKWPSGQVPIDR